MSANDPLDRTQKAPLQPDKTVPAIGPDARAGGRAPDPASPKPASENDPLIGRELGGCLLDSLLGRGAMGAVYRSRQLRLEREVAVKVIRPELLTDARILKRFQNEAKIVSKFNSPHVVTVHDVGFDLGVHFLVMEFVSGKDLRAHTKLLPGGRLPVVEAVVLLRQACLGLEEAHRLGVLHRDIKPDNLMLTDRGVLKIADFGIAKPAQQDLGMTMTSELIGTPLYMSPEQCQAATDLDFRSDMYSLGATFYYLLTGEPPFKASSMYELIQTKTKLENLCLWKALPELDENHPLSRVIERMTALSREDRYPSYAALVQDLALVEQGRTLEIQQPRRKPAPAPVVAPTHRGRNLTLCGIAVLVLAGVTAFLWSRDPKGAAERLQTARDRLASAGPTESLRAELAALELPAELSAELQSLRDDVALGLAVKAKLQEKPPPAALELPFDDLRAHFRHVAEAVKVEGRVGPELTAWLAAASRSARSEATFGASAAERLHVAFDAWQTSLHASGDEGERRAQLRKPLEGIETAQRNLLELLPRLAPPLEAGKLKAAHEALEMGERVPVPDPVPDPPYRVLLDLEQIQSEFDRDGPSPALVNRVKKLDPKEADRKACSDLVNRLEWAQKALERAIAVRLPSTAPQLPFTDVETFYTELDDALKSSADSSGKLPDGKLPEWARRIRTDRGDEQTLGQKALQQCRTAWGRLQPRLASADGLDAKAQEAMAMELVDLEAGIGRGKRLFTSLATQFADLVPKSALDSALAGARAAAGTAQRRAQWLEKFRPSMERLTAVASVAEWRNEKAAITSALTALRGDARDLASDTAVAAEQKRADSLAASWEDAETRVLAVARALAGGDLPAADIAFRAGPAAKGIEEFRAFELACKSSRDAFGAIDRSLDLKSALARLEEAKTALKLHGSLEPEAGARLDQWKRAIENLQGLAADMVPIAAGRTKAGVQLGAFFFARTETKQVDYVEFLQELQALVKAAGDDADARQTALAARLGPLVLPPDVLQGMLRRRSSPEKEDLPVEEVCWFEAAAYAAWRDRSLPNAAEWALAAFGDGHQHSLPWGGNEWKDTAAVRNIGGSAVRVASGGASWREGLHHVAGNVAEWLAAEPTATEAQFAGGSYRDNDVRRDVERRARGEEFGKAGLKRAVLGVGFRTILKPQQFLAKDFAGNTFPAMR